MDEAVVLVPEMWAAFPTLARTAALAWACAPGQRRLRRRLWDLRNWLLHGGLQTRYITRHLVLTTGEMLDGLLHRYEILCHLLHLRRVDGVNGGRSLRNEW